MLAAYLAFAIDAFIGDPKTDLHPVALMGKLIAGLEKLLYRSEHGDKQKFWRGAVLVLLVLFISYEAATVWLHLAYYLTEKTGWSYLTPLMTALALSFMISPRSLARAGREIYELLVKEDITTARQKVGWIVGRDTAKLEAPEIVRATVETVAENTVDGVVSPLFFFFLGGLPLAVLYRAANTLDSMVGYKNDKYLYFGRPAAKLDDVLNYAPARLTAWLIIGAAWLLKLDHRNALLMARRDAHKHPSPNGGWAEASVAGALHVRLGGLNYYFGQPHFRAYMGEALQPLSPRHILEAIRLMYTATVLLLITAYLLFFSLGYPLLK